MVDNAPVCPAVGARTRGTYHKRMHPATAEDRRAPGNDGMTFMGNAFGSAAYLAELLPIYVSRALSQIATPPIPTE